MSILANLSDIYFPETLYASWMSVSFILITLSLLFYHMTRLKSIRMDSRYAAIYSVILILIACFISFISIFPYYSRFSFIYKQYPDKLNNENIYHKLYILCGIIVITIQLLIALTIIKVEFYK